MKSLTAVLPPFLLLDRLLQDWLLEDIGRGDRTTGSLLCNSPQMGKAKWIAKEAGIIAGLPIAARVFQLLSQQVNFTALVAEGERCGFPPGTLTESKPVIATIM